VEEKAVVALVGRLQEKKGQGAQANLQQNQNYLYIID
jgi:hypothetical protein